MPEVEANGVRLYYELYGSGEPLALVHGGWADGTFWQLVVPGLAESFRVLVYDRRGHSRSERRARRAASRRTATISPRCWRRSTWRPPMWRTNSSGGNVALRLAMRRPDVFRLLCCHEPPLWGLLADDPESQEVLRQSSRAAKDVSGRIAEGDHEGAARQFVELVLGPGAWENELPREIRAIYVLNAPTFLDDVRDPTFVSIDEAALARLEYQCA